jgi:hypothetical protein
MLLGSQLPIGCGFAGVPLSAKTKTKQKSHSYA